MARAIREHQRASFWNICSVTLPSTPEGSIPLEVTEIPQSPRWWFRPAQSGRPGGMWASGPSGLHQVLTWCPEVITHLVAHDSAGANTSNYYTLRVNGHLATLSDHHLSQGKGWEHFPGIDLWECFTACDPLHRVVRQQARSAPRVTFEGAA